MINSRVKQKDFITLCETDVIPVNFFREFGIFMNIRMVLIVRNQEGHTEVECKIIGFKASGVFE